MLLLCRDELGCVVPWASRECARDPQANKKATVRRLRLLNSRLKLLLVDRGSTGLNYYFFFFFGLRFNPYFGFVREAWAFHEVSLIRVFWGIKNKPTRFCQSTRW